MAPRRVPGPSLLPLGLYSGAPIVLLIVAFWSALAVRRSPAKKYASTPRARDALGMGTELADHRDSR